MSYIFAADKFFIREESIKESPTYSIDEKVLYEDAIKENLAKDAYLKRLAKFIRECNVVFKTMKVKRLMEPFIKKA